MLKSHIHNIILPKYFGKVKKKGSSLNFSALGGRDKEKNRKPAEKIAGISSGRAKRKKGGLGEMNFCPPAPSGVGSVSAILR